MPRRYSSREVEALLRSLGFAFIRQRGSHRRFRGGWQGRERNVSVVAGQRQIPEKTLRSIADQAGFTLDELKLRLDALKGG